MYIIKHSFINKANESMSIEIWQNNQDLYHVTLYMYNGDVVENFMLDSISTAIFKYANLIHKYSK